MSTKLKYILISLLVIFVGFQIYFDLALRKTNGVLVNHIATIEEFIRQELPGQMAHFNGTQSSAPVSPSKTK